MRIQLNKHQIDIISEAARDWTTGELSSKDERIADTVVRTMRAYSTRYQFNSQLVRWRESGQLGLRKTDTIDVVLTVPCFRVAIRSLREQIDTITQSATINPRYVECLQLLESYALAAAVEEAELGVER